MDSAIVARIQDRVHWFGPELGTESLALKRGNVILNCTLIQSHMDSARPSRDHVEFRWHEDQGSVQ